RASWLRGRLPTCACAWRPFVRGVGTVAMYHRPPIGVSEPPRGHDRLTIPRMTQAAASANPISPPPAAAPSPPTLYLIDGYAQFFRAYHAIRTPMSSPVTKEPTNMSFGFIGMLLKLLRGEGRLGGRPEFVALTLDVSGDRGTFRSELYPEYKANRP